MILVAESAREGVRVVVRRNEYPPKIGVGFEVWYFDVWHLVEAHGVNISDLANVCNDGGCADVADER